MRKRIFLLLLALMCVLSCTAMAENSRTVVATTYPLYDIAISICGNLAQVQYEPEASEEQASKGEVLLCVGSEADSWVDQLEDVKIVKAVDGLDLIDGDMDVLTIPVNCMISASYFADAMGAMDPENNGVYQHNLAHYIATMSAIDSHIRENVYDGLKISCADGSMAYFAREYGLINAQGEKGAAELRTYNYPAEDQLGISYAELIHANLHALTGVPHSH